MNIHYTQAKESELWVSQNMKIWVVIANIEELQARGVERVLTQKKKQSNILKNMIVP